MTEEPLPHDPERRRIAGAGTDEARWNAANLDDMPSCRVDDWGRRFRRIWLVAPHPDDEILALGGCIAHLADTAAALHIVSVTDGEASHVGSVKWTRERLAAERPDELRRGLERLGSPAEVLRLHLPDGRVNAHRQTLLQTLLARVEEDDLLLVTCRFDGHPDHEACGDVAVLASELTGARVIEYPVWMWHWAVPGETAIPWARAQRIELSDAIVVRKQAAITAFQSQIQVDDEHEAILPVHVLRRFQRPFEVVFVTP